MALSLVESADHQLVGEWKIPVRVQVGKHAPLAIRTPAEALSLLLNRWPTAGGKYHQEARHMCSMALRRTIPSEVARETFVSATLEAEILVP